MPETRVCPVCHGKIPPSADFCPRCLLGPCLHPSSSENAASRSFVPPAADELTETIPGVEIIELIGRGGMGCVYRGRQPAQGRAVAVKLLPGGPLAHPEFEERFKREARALQELRHPNIVTLYDSGTTTEGHHYLLMESVEGVNLSERGAELRASRDANALGREVAAMMVQLCEALDYAHRRGVIHRDIKPANVLIQNDGHVKVVDFGLVKLDASRAATQTELTLTRSTMGTRSYMAPEQAQPGSSVDHRADIYSAGVVLYQLLTGHLPEGVFEWPSKSRAGLDKRFDDVVRRAMQRDPARRFQSAEEMARALRKTVSKDSRKRMAILPWALSIGAATLLLWGGLTMFKSSDRQAAVDSDTSRETLAAHAVTRIFRTDPEHVLRPEIPEDAGHFGQTLAFKDGVLAVGAPGKVNISNGGQVALYDLSSSATKPKLMTRLGPQSGDDTVGFGTRLSLDVDHLLVGQNGPEASSVYLFRRKSPLAEWEAATRLEIPGGRTGGMPPSLLLDGERLFLGVPAYAASGAVFAHLLDRGTATVSLLQTLSPVETSGGLFGGSIAFHGTTLAVGDPSAPLQAGIVRLFAMDRRSGMWRPETSLTDPAAADGEEWGSNLAFNENGRLLVVGAPARLENQGAVSVFEQGREGWQFRQSLEPPDAPGNSPRFGEAVAWIGKSWLAVSAPGAEGTGTGSGSVYLFRRFGTSEFSPAGRLLPHAPEVKGLGTALAVAGSRLAVSSKEPSPGCVYLFPLDRLLEPDQAPEAEPPAPRPWQAVPDFGGNVFEDRYNDGLAEMHDGRRRYVLVTHAGKTLEEDAGRLVFQDDGALWGFASLRDRHIHQWNADSETLAFVWELGNVRIRENDAGNEDYNVSLRLLSASQSPDHLEQRTFRLENEAAQLDLAIFFNEREHAFMKLDYKDGSGLGEHRREGHGHFIGQVPLDGWDGAPGSGFRKIWIRLAPETLEVGWDGGLERIEARWEAITLDPKAPHGFGAGIWTDHLGKNIWGGRGGHQVSRYGVYRRGVP